MKFRSGQLVRVKNGSRLNPGNIRIITGYEEDKGLYLSKRATKQGKINKRTEGWILRSPEDHLEPVENSITINRI